MSMMIFLMRMSMTDLHHADDDYVGDNDSGIVDRVDDDRGHEEDDAHDDIHHGHAYQDGHDDHGDG